MFFLSNHGTTWPTRVPSSHPSAEPSEPDGGRVGSSRVASCAPETSRKRPTQRGGQGMPQKSSEIARWYHVISFDWGKMLINIDKPCWDTFLQTNSNQNIRKTRHGHLLNFPCAKPAFWTRNCILDPHVMVMHPTHQRSIASSSSPSRWRIHEILIHPDFPPSLSSKGADGAPSTQHSWSSQVRFLKNLGKRLSTWQQRVYYERQLWMPTRSQDFLWAKTCEGLVSSPVFETCSPQPGRFLPLSKFIVFAKFPKNEFRFWGVLSLSMVL